MLGLYRSRLVGMPDFVTMPDRDDIDLETGLIRRPAPRHYPSGPVSVAAVLDAGVRDHPSRPAVIDDMGVLTYLELDQEVHRVAAAIQARTRPAEVLAWCLPNSADLVVGFLATLRVGRVWLGVNPRLPGDARADLVRRSGAQIVVDVGFKWPVAKESTPYLANEPIDPHAPAVMSPTSGTTGQPKLVVHSQHGLLWPGLSSIETEPFEENERTLCALPLTTLTLMTLGPLTAMLRGGTVVIGSTASPPALLNAIEKHSVTRLIAVPTLLHDLAQELQETGASRPVTLRSVLVGGAGTAPDLRQRFETVVGIRPVLSYGLSETPTGVARTDSEHPHSAAAMPPVHISTVDENGRDTPVGSTGRIRIEPMMEGPWAGSWQPMLGYWHHPDATAAALDGEGLLTEDLGQIDEHGRLRVVGRMNDVILRGGTNVMPAEIEAAMLSHPLVREVAVVGVPDARLGERIAAAVVLDSELIDAEALRAHTRATLSGDRVPSEIQVVYELPRNSLGKVIRRDVVAFFT
ncbi:MAG: AMP-binding protein [Acidimicrobiaceae bacterium]|nr:AMP-binding protein [Acidimicrobiaceae bacterium]